jgi:hypothetical protein
MREHFLPTSSLCQLTPYLDYCILKYLEREVIEIQDSPDIDEVLKELDLAEELVNTFAVRAKRYWMGWGPAGVPMLLAIEAWAEGQLRYLKWLRARVLEL